MVNAYEYNHTLFKIKQALHKNSHTFFTFYFMYQSVSRGREFRQVLLQRLFIAYNYVGL